MRLLVVGAGSTGGYFGGRLAEAGRSVSFLVRPARAERLRAEGLRITSPHGDVALSPHVVTKDAIDGAYDAVLLAVKAFALDAALDDLAPAVGAETMIVPMLNGMGHMDVLTTRFGARNVVGGVCKIAAMLKGDGRIVQLAPFHELVYGERDGTETARSRALDAFMQGAGFDAKLSMTVEREMWEKWILLATLGAITCLMRGNVGEIAAAPTGGAFVNALLDEVVTIVRAVGTAPSEVFLTTARASMTARGSPMTSSMYRDLQAGSRVEADQIVGDLVQRGARAGVAAPLLAAAYANLCVYQNRLG